MTQIMVDTVGSDAGNIPAGAPKVAYYLTGGSGIAWVPSALERFRGAKVPIDQAPFDNPWLSLPHVVLDIESGADQLAIAIEQARTRAQHGLDTTFYISAGNLGAALAAVAAAGLQAHVWYWVANWNLSQLEAAALLHGRIVAIQFASPTSNPDLQLPGSRLTLRQANCDLSVTIDTWFPAPSSKPKSRRPPKPHPKVTTAGLAGAIATAATTAAHSAGLHLTTVETGTITAVAAVLAAYLKS